MPPMHDRTFRVMHRLLKRLDTRTGGDLHIRLSNWRLDYHNADYRFGEDQVAFLHIPKTAGTSMHELLGTLPPGTIVNLQLNRPVSIHCPPGRYRYIAMMRDPIARVWSYYNMALRLDVDNPYQHHARQGLAFFLEHCWEVREMATRYLSGRVHGEPNRACRDIALQNLERMYFVGLFEELHTELPRLVRLLGGSDQGLQLPHHRKASYPPPNEEETALIRRYNRHDMDLYRVFVEQRRSG